MIETMRERLARIERECGCITGFVASLKCKTEDGKICTLMEITARKNDCPEILTLAEYANSEFTKAVLHTMNLMESEDFIYSDVENMVIKSSTIIRVWVEHEYNESDDQPSQGEEEQHENS